ncbi:NUDIX hydrolase [Haloglycomyces albus]|uniref:NUDIX hydrolase n=1 Tax=Haloglycomyces albus TaxID=526067 RepID=UPI00046D695F|nr:CoA pyrophosphatase [Haloglycomyces albus]
MSDAPEWWFDLLRAVDDESGRSGSLSSLPTAQRASGARSAAVLVLLADGDEGPEIVLQERAHHLRHHPGQMSFPGGALEECDADATDAALREAEEELGVKPAGVEIGVELPPLWIPVSSYLVTCVLARWSEPHPVQPVDVNEVAAVHSVSLRTLAHPENRGTVTYPSGRTGPGFHVDGVPLIWGFTGGVLSWLISDMGMERDWDPDRFFSLEQQRRVWQRRS